MIGQDVAKMIGSQMVFRAPPQACWSLAIIGNDHVSVLALP